MQTRPSGEESSCRIMIMRVLCYRLRFSMSPRDITILIGTIATISMVITFQVFRNVPVQPELKKYFQENSEGRFLRNVDNGDGYEYVESQRNIDPYQVRVTAEVAIVPSMDERFETTPGGIYETPTISEMNSTSLSTKTENWDVIRDKIVQIESTMQEISSIRHQVAVLSSDSSYPNKVQQHPLSTVLQKHGYSVATDIQSNPWHLLWCFKKDMNCAAISQSSNLKMSQRVNVIPALDDHLGSKSALCQTYNSVRNIPSFKKSNLGLPCFIFPYQFEDFVMTTSALGSDTRWVLHTVSNNSTSLQLIQPSSTADFVRLKQYKTQHAVVQQYFSNPALLFGMPFNVQVLVLVTSVSPLRAYIHSSGAVQYRHDYQRNFQKVLNRVWSLERFRQYLTHHYGRGTSNTAFRNLNSVIVQTLLAAEYQDQLTHPRCKTCFQLFGFEAIFNTSFHPMISDVVRDPLSDWYDVINNTHIFDDVINLVVGATTTPPDGSFVNTLKEVATQSGYAISCNDKKSARCLNGDGDLWYLITQRREVQNIGGFKQLYPASDGARYATVFDDFLRVAKLKHMDKGACCETARLHPLLVGLEKYEDAKKSQDNYDEDSPLPIEDAPDHTSLIEHAKMEQHHTQRDFERPRCSESSETIPYLTGIYTKPHLNLTPKFYPATLEYRATVPYDVLLVTVWAFAKSCSCEARLDEKYGYSRPANYTLGIGENRINIFVVEVTHSDPWVISSYTVYIERSGRHGNTLTFTPKLPHQVCRLKQDCSLRYVPYEPCGLQTASHNSWTHLIHHVTELPFCRSGDMPGEWLLPCSRCEDSSTCFWDHALWQPLSCQHRQLSSGELQTSMAGKKILFLGDSTNRGVMHYIMQRVNGSLCHWDKTHNIKHYTNLNQNRTSVSFAYFPQFWLPAGKRPVIASALQQLVYRSMPLRNDHSTVLVLGGVQWLSTHHLTAAKSFLYSQGLGNIKLIMKSLGAGFHQPVEGLRCLSLKEQQILLRRNRDLCMFARSRRFKVIDTFNITMARYKDFLQGKCGCHFHKVTEIENPAATARPSYVFGSLAQSGILDQSRTKANLLQIHRPASDRGDTQTDSVQYHVEGEINKVYSEMVINEICND